MQKLTLLTFIVIVSLALLPSCYYNKGDILGGIVCDTVSVSYSDQIRSILDNNCMVCHDAAGIAPIKFENYEQVFTVAQSGQLLGAIKHEEPYQPMPRNKPKLDPCYIRQVEIWIDEGAQNN